MKFKKGNIPWNKGNGEYMIGEKNHFFGKKHTAEARAKISEFLKTRPHSQKQKDAVSKATSGSKNVNWKGGITSYRLAIRRGARWINWRKAVMERDDYTCKQCGSRCGTDYDGTVKLEAHHPLPVRKLIKTKFEKYIFDIRNGITLCNPCHNLIKITR